MAAPYPYLDHPGPIPFAHRGGAGDFPENTMAAFEHAVALGYRYLETDVHTTSDGEVVVFHDDVLDRVTDRSGRVADLPWSEVRRARIGEAGEPVPRLADLLATWPDARINIDLKHDATVDPLVEVLRSTGAYDRVCAAAFSDARLRRFRRLTGHQVCTATGPREVARLRLRLPGSPAGACAQVPRRYGGIRIVDAAFVASAHSRGLPVHVWTIDDEPTMDRLLDLGVDGIMTDRPALLRSVLERRGQWH